MKINQQVIVKRWKPIFETMCNQLGIKHIYTRPYRSQTNGKFEAFWKPSGRLLATSSSILIY
ncbi:MAG: DDE-type integrase/transposase/recombinase [Firmicutes bacterium]|nr:DDE-type integrase/transposase/recombinase [Bacillota bacterium]